MSRRIAGRNHRRHFVARINSRAQSPPSDIYVRRTYSGGLATPNGHRWDSRAKIRFAPDPLLEGTGFEPVWGFSCQVSFSFGAGSLFGAGKPFFVPSPAIRFAERAEGVKGPKR